jgi:hypothetical protein
MLEMFAKSLRIFITKLAIEWLSTGQLLLQQRGRVPSASSALTRTDFDTSAKHPTGRPFPEGLSDQACITKTSAK